MPAGLSASNQQGVPFSVPAAVCRMEKALLVGEVLLGGKGRAKEGEGTQGKRH